MILPLSSDDKVKVEELADWRKRNGELSAQAKIKHERTNVKCQSGRPYRLFAGILPKAFHVEPNWTLAMSDDLSLLLTFQNRLMLNW